jgi:uncharacterized membrane-anchored protein YitT (DUF2179 family)
VLLLSVTEIIFLLSPFFLAIAGFWIHIGAAHIVAIFTSAILVFIHYLIITVTNPGNWWLALVNFPIVVFAEIALNHASMYKYEFSTVDWKGRNICLPVMHVTPRLPKV